MAKVVAGRLLLKPGATLEPIAPAGYVLLAALKATARTLELDLTITSGTDGVHSGPDDPHKTGEAYDVRSQGFTHEQKVGILAEVLAQLQRGEMDAPIETSNGIATMRFYGFLEAPGTTNEHFHFQRRRGTTYTAADLLNA